MSMETQLVLTPASDQITSEAGRESAGVESVELACLLALDLVPRLGPVRLKTLLEKAGSAQALWHASPVFLQGFLRDKERDAFEATRQRVTPAALPEQYERLGIQVLSQQHPDYPQRLKEIYDPPTLLYIRGNPKMLTGKTLAVVGARRMSDYGHRVTQRLISDLAGSGVTIVSGLAEGIDGEAHRSAMKHGLATVAVFGCGVDVIYPKRHLRLADDILEDGGALVSEYPLGTQPDKFTFPQRNRIVAGLSYAAIVVEGTEKSGSLITARLAAEEGRTVYTVPGNIFSPGAQGPIRLLQTGAMPVASGLEILQDLGWLPDGAARQETSRAGASTVSQGLGGDGVSSLTPVEEKLLACIGYEPVGIDRVQQQCGLDAATVSQGLTLLELNGQIGVLPGAQVFRK